MRLMFSGLLVFAIASTAALGTASAQPDVRDHRERKGPPPDVRDRRRPPPPPDTAGPREAPPAPREEKLEARPGFVWVRGRWDWKGGKWEWVAGHWERERAAKRWVDGRWDRKGDTWVYVAGQWVDSGVVPAPPDGRPREAPPAPREEKYDARPGFVWVRGHWDWKGGKWDWVAGRWERERAGKRWRDVRWELKDGYYTRIDGDWEDGAGPGPGPRPREAPPAPREEKYDARPGFVWVRGHWDWKDGKWDWVAGRWERERAGKRWRDVRWELKDGYYTRIDGDWEDGSGPPDRPDRPDRPRREWKLERPVVSSYWPARGKAGTRVVIRGKNFPADATVMFAGAPVRAAKVTADRITFEVPGGAPSGQIAVNTGKRRPLPVGMFEVAAGYDPVAEQKKLEDERRRKAEAAWRERAKQIAKDRAAREAAQRAREDERARNRDQRRAERLAALRARWDRAFLADPETQDELTLHAQRVAELVRMREVAELSNNGKLVVRIEIAQSREDDRHEQRMAALKASFGAKAGAP